MIPNPFDEHWPIEGTEETFLEFMGQSYERRNAYVRERVRDHLRQRGLLAPLVLYRFNDRKVRTVKTLQVAWIIPSVQRPGKIQVTRAIWDGPFNDTQYPTYEQALKEAFQEGWRETTPRLLDRFARTWNFGA